MYQKSVFLAHGMEGATEGHTKVQSMEKLNTMMKSSDTVDIFDGYDGFVVNGVHIETSQEMVFSIIPHTNIKSFSYTSDFVIPNFSCFTGVPRSLKNIELSTWRGVSDIVIEQLIDQGVKCSTPYDTTFEHLNLIQYSDSGNYKREGGCWVRYDIVTRVPNGYLYCVKDSHWKNDLKVFVLCE